MTEGSNTKQALSKARAIGLIVELVPGTGEIRVRRPDGGPSVRINARRKDAVRALLRMIREWEKEHPR